MFVNDGLNPIKELSLHAPVNRNKSRSGVRLVVVRVLLTHRKIKAIVQAPTYAFTMKIEYSSTVLEVHKICFSN